MVSSSWDDFDRICRLNRVMNACTDKQLNIIAEALYLGYPKFTNSKEVPTACVGFTKDGRLIYLWNREFFDKATDLALQYVCFHETMHVVLQHSHRRLDREPRLWNLAVDIVVNQSLDEMVTSCKLMDLPDINADPTLKERLRPNFMNLNIQDESAEDVYDKLLKVRAKLPKPKCIVVMMGSGGQGKPEDEGGEGEGEDDEGNSGSQEGQGEEQETLDGHGQWEGVCDSETQSKIDQIVEDLKEANGIGDDTNNPVPAKKGGGSSFNKKKRSKPSGYGSSSGHLIVELGEIGKARPIPWQRLLRNRIMSAYRPNEGDNWARPHRKLYNQYPDILLPGTNENEMRTNRIFLSIDTSGSMDDELIAELVGIVNSLPAEEYEVTVIWFDTQVYEAPDLNKPQGRGGTDFQEIENVAKGASKIYDGNKPIGGSSGYWNRKYAPSEIVLKSYPDVIIVLTDGESSTPNLEHPERWIWMITENGNDNAVGNLGSTVFNL